MRKVLFAFPFIFILFVLVYVKLNFTLIELNGEQMAELNAARWISSSVLVSDETGYHASPVFLHIGKYALVRKAQ